ncbi:pyridoxamine 5'-phosphate oxidase family protein [Gemmatimonadota bacterium]
MSPEHLHPRRKDRSKDEAWIRGFLHRSGAAVLSTVRDGRPYPIPILFAYDQDREAIYLHSGKGARTRANLEAGSAGSGEDGEPAGKGVGAPVALICFEMGRLLPADEALEFGVEYASVVVSGRGAVVGDEDEAEHGLHLIMEKYAPHLRPGRDYRPIAPSEVKRTSVFRLEIQAWSGKQRAAETDFPGAYWLADVREGIGSG